MPPSEADRRNSSSWPKWTLSLLILGLFMVGLSQLLQEYDVNHRVRRVLNEAFKSIRRQAFLQAGADSPGEALEMIEAVLQDVDLEERINAPTANSLFVDLKSLKAAAEILGHQRFLEFNEIRDEDFASKSEGVKDYFRDFKSNVERFLSFEGKALELLVLFARLLHSHFDRAYQDPDIIALLGGESFRQEGFQTRRKSLQINDPKEQIRIRWKPLRERFQKVTRQATKQLWKQSYGKWRPHFEEQYEQQSRLMKEWALAQFLPTRQTVFNALRAHWHILQPFIENGFTELRLVPFTYALTRLLVQAQADARKLRQPVWIRSRWPSPPLWGQAEPCSHPDSDSSYFGVDSFSKHSRKPTNFSPDYWRLLLVPKDPKQGQLPKTQFLTQGTFKYKTDWKNVRGILYPEDWLIDFMTRAQQGQIKRVEDLASVMPIHALDPITDLLLHKKTRFGFIECSPQGTIDLTWHSKLQANMPIRTGLMIVIFN